MSCRWGCTHEKEAIEAYIVTTSKNHDNFQVQECGLYIDPEIPFLGASPDGIVSCKCCGEGVLEVKCPFSIKDGIPDTLPDKFFMCKQDGKLTLKKEHAYYFQVQMQLAVCKFPYCDFVVWTTTGLAIERISADEHFFRSRFDNLQHFFIYGILPEIVGKWYTRIPVTNSDGIVPQPVRNAPSNTDVDTGEDITKLWCYCNMPSFGDMVMCDNKNCTIQWFHFECLSIRNPPKGKWYCPSCCKLPKFSRKKH